MELTADLPAYCAVSTGQAALERLLALTEPQARTVLSRCAAALSLYPAWERHDWVMPEPKWALRAYGGHFLDLERVARQLGDVRHQPGKNGYLHVPSGLAFAAHQAAHGQVTLILGGLNSSDGAGQLHSLLAEAQQLGAGLLNVVGGVPRLYRWADRLTLLLHHELSREGRPLTLTGHSLGGGLAQYAGLMNNLSVLAFSPTALGHGVLDIMEDTGRLADPAAVIHLIRSYSLAGDPIPSLGTGWLHAAVVGEHLWLPRSPGVPPVRYATNHGQIYSHLAAHLHARWPDLPNATPGF